MRTLTAEEIGKINEMNGTCTDRYEYLDKIAEILNVSCTNIAWMTNSVKGVALDKNTVLDIATRTIKGKKTIDQITIVELKGNGIKSYFYDKKTKCLN